MLIGFPLIIFFHWNLAQRIGFIEVSWVDSEECEALFFDLTVNVRLFKVAGEVCFSQC